MTSEDNIFWKIDITGNWHDVLKIYFRNDYYNFKFIPKIGRRMIGDLRPWIRFKRLAMVSSVLIYDDEFDQFELTEEAKQAVKDYLIEERIQERQDLQERQ